MVGSTFWDKTSIHAILYKAYGKVCQTIPQGICCLHVDLQTMCIKRSLHSTSHCPGSEQGEHCSVLLLRHSLHIQGKCSFHLGTASQHCLTSFSFSNVCGSFKPEDSVLGLVCHLLWSQCEVQVQITLNDSTCSLKPDLISCRKDTDNAKAEEGSHIKNST